MDSEILLSLREHYDEISMMVALSLSARSVTDCNIFMQNFLSKQLLHVECAVDEENIINKLARARINI